MAALMRKCEFAILTCNKEIVYKAESDLPQVVCSFLEGKYEAILESNLIATQILTQVKNDEQFSGFSGYVQQNIDALLAQQDDDEIRDLTILLVAASCLQLFVQNNWLGPPTSKEPLQFCHKDLDEKAEREAFSELSLNGETVYTRSRFILFLYIARIILLNYRDRFKHLQSWDWWLMRCLVIHQALLSDKSPTLKSTLSELVDEISKQEPLIVDDSNRDIQVMFHVEAGHSFHTYYEYNKAAEQFETAKKKASISIEMTGAMGKRTRFQQEDKAQLILVVKRNEEANDVSVVDNETEPLLPKILPLDDDTVLNEVAYTEENMDCATKLSPFEQVLILGLMESYRRSRAEERLTTEEVLTYISYILSHVSNWSVAVCALNVRSKLERDRRRTVERSMLQLEELANRASKPESSPNISCRIPLFYAANVPSLWTVQRDLAALLLSLGLTGEALDVFEKLEMWDDVIACYQKMGKMEKAEFVIRQRLAVEETPALYCFLGDVTRSLEHYQRAWELSNHRSARAMRCMGYIYFQEKQFEKALECFSASLEINSLQIPVWFTYGCTAMACEKFDLGVKGFRRCVSIEYDNFEAWANLATCLVRLKEKHKAYSTLQDALRCNYENWRLWENSLIIGTDCGEFEDVIRSYHRLMDLKQKYVDAEVLDILTRAVVEKIPDANGTPADRLWLKLVELFGRVTSRVTSDADIWASYAKLYSFQIGERQPDFEKASGFQQKAVRCLTQKVDWEKDKELCKKVSERTIAFTETQIQLCSDKPPPETLKTLPATRLMLKGILVKIQKQHTDPITQEMDPEVSETCKSLEFALNQLVERIEVAKSLV